MKPTLTPNQNLDDLIFENRNKSYGAYALRFSYESRIKKAFTMAVSAFLFALFLISHVAFKKGNSTVALPDLSEPLDIIACPLPPSLPEEEKAAAPVQKKLNPEEGVLTPVEKKEDKPKEEPKTVISSSLTNTATTNGTGESKTTTNSNSESGSTGNTNSNNSSENTTVTQGWAEEMPQYIGGDDAMRKYIITHFNVPNYIDDDNIKIRLFFVVDEEGKITDITISKGASEVLDKEAVRVVASMPKWKPGKMGGRAVKVRYSLPITIKLK